MDQTHISYTYWQQPPKDILPASKVVTPLEGSEMGVAIEGSDKWWPDENAEALLPEFDSYNQQSYYIDIFNRGSIPFNYSVSLPSPLHIDQASGIIEKEKRIWVSINWKKVTSEDQKIPITIKGSNGTVIVQAVVRNTSLPKSVNANTFVESNGYVSIEAEHFSRAVNTNDITWQRIPNLGRTLSSVTAFPVTAPKQSPGNNNPRELHSRIEAGRNQNS